MMGAGKNIMIIRGGILYRAEKEEGASFLLEWFYEIFLMQ